MSLLYEMTKTPEEESCPSEEDRNSSGRTPIDDVNQAFHVCPSHIFPCVQASHCSPPVKDIARSLDFLAAESLEAIS